jgi:nucleotide-binding universal stress UspA family protein
MGALSRSPRVERMTGGVIVGYEGSDRSRDALAFAEALAAAQDAQLIVACVHPYQPGSSAVGDAGFGREVRAGAQRIAESARELLARGDEAEFCAALGVSPAEGLGALARERGADTIVVASSSRGRLGQVLCGTVATRLVHDAPCAVGVAPAGYAKDHPSALSSVGAAFDGSPASQRALHLAERLAARFRGRLRIIAVDEDARHGETLSPQVDEAVVAAPLSARAVGVVRHGDPARELALASADLDALLCGTHGYGRARRFVLGSVSTGLMRTARCPLLVVQRA